MCRTITRLCIRTAIPQQRFWPQCGRSCGRTSKSSARAAASFPTYTSPRKWRWRNENWQHSAGKAQEKETADPAWIDDFLCHSVLHQGNRRWSNERDIQRAEITQNFLERFYLYKSKKFCVIKMAIDWRTCSLSLFLFPQPCLKSRSPFQNCPATPKEVRATKKDFSRNTALSAKGYLAFAEQKQACIRLILGFWSRQKSV